MLDNILSKRFAVTSFFMLWEVDKTLKTYLCTRFYEGYVDASHQGCSVASLVGVRSLRL